MYKYYENNINDEELILSPDDKLLINYKQFYDKIEDDMYDSKCTNLLLDNKLSLILALNLKENKPIDNDEEILDILINKKIETKNDCILYLDLLINVFKNYSKLYSNEDNDKFMERLNILLGLPVPIVNSGEADIKYICGKYYDKYTILTNIIKELEINKDTAKLLNLFFDLMNINDMIYNYINNLPAPNSFKYSYADYILKYYIVNKEELEKLENDGSIMNKLSNSYNNIINNYKINNLDNNISISDKLYFSDFSYELINHENINIKLYQMNIKYAILKESKKTNLDCFNNTSFFSTINNNIDNKELKEELKEEKKEDLKGENEEKKEELKEEKKEEKEKEIDEIQLDNFNCILIYCHDDLDISVEFKPYFNSKLEIKGKKNLHYIFYCINKDKILDYSKIKIETKKGFSELKFNYIINLGGGNMNVMLGPGSVINVTCEVCGVNNPITTKTTELKCSFCECPLNNVTKI